MAGLVPAIPTIRHYALLIEIAGTSPAMTDWRPAIFSRYSLGVHETSVIHFFCLAGK